MCAWDSVDRNPLVLQKEISRVVCWVEPWPLILFIDINRQISFYYSHAYNIKSCMLGTRLTEIPRICWRKLVRLPFTCSVEPWSLVGPCPLLPRPWLCGWQEGTCGSDRGSPLPSCWPPCVLSRPLLTPQKLRGSYVLYRVIPGTRRNLVSGILCLLLVSFPPLLSLSFSILLVP